MIQFCDRVAEAISAYVDGEQTDKHRDCGLDRASIEAHLRACTYCGALQHHVDKTTSVLRSTIEAPPARVWNGIEDALRAEGIITSD